MSAVLLIPGAGGRYTSENFTSTSTGADTIDCRRCTGLILQVAITGTTAGGTFQLQELLTGSTYADLGSPIVVAAGITKLEAANRPFGKVIINPANATGQDASNYFTVSMEGQAIGSGLT